MRSFFLGLELGTLSDTSSLAVVEMNTLAKEKHYEVRHLERFPIGTAYPDIRTAVENRIWQIGTPSKAALNPADPKVYRCTLIIDETATGASITKLFRGLDVDFQSVVITAGRTVSARGTTHNLPKLELAANLQQLFQRSRVKFAKLAETESLVSELQNFKLRAPAQINDDLISWRERAQDDLCFAVMMALWFGERVRKLNAW